MLAEADSQNRQGVRRLPEQVEAHTRLIRGLRAGGEQNGVRAEAQGLARAHIIIADNPSLGAQLLRVMHEVIGKTVIIIDNEEH